MTEKIAKDSEFKDVINKNSTNKFVQRARNAQEHNLINNYYTLTKIIKKI